MSTTATATLAPPAQAGGLDSLYEMVTQGGPMMVPLALCSVVALAYAVERSVRLRAARLGTRRFGDEVLREAEAGGALRALSLCENSDSAMSRVLRTGLRRWGAPFLEIEKAVEDAGAREVRELAANLRPLTVVAMIAPLLGLLGTVWGMILAFGEIAQADGLGRPELLATGISQALVTTAAGLAIAIPTQAVYYFFKARIDRFARTSETIYVRLVETLSGAGEDQP